MKKKLNYQNIEVGEELGKKEVLITDEMIQACANAIESKHPWYFEDSPFGGRIAPPTIFDNDTLRMLDEKYHRFGSIHTRQIWDFKNPAKLGKRITLSARIIDKYIKRGRGYLTMELAAIDEDGLEICRGWHTSLISLEKGTGK
ncbi:MAG: MaoC family dehydratase N-terminal domain-containing protein [Candidatus Binatia bacterium]